MTNIFSISANELVGKLKKGDLSCVEVCKAYINQIETLLLQAQMENLLLQKFYMKF